jgi:hypothetical protein
LEGGFYLSEPTRPTLDGENPPSTDHEAKPPLEGGSTFEEAEINLEARIREGDAGHRRQITLYLIWLLAAVVILDPTLIMIMEWNGKTHEGLTNVFGTLLPVVAGLTGGAIGYYTKTDK